MSRSLVSLILRAAAVSIPLLLASLRARTFADQVAQAEPRAWLYFDGPLWDLADEGLPFRATLALPSSRDPLTRLLRGSEARWTLSAGYAKVYNSFDDATGIQKSHGGHALLASAGREFFWDAPRSWQPWAPRLAIEFGVNFASRPFPADGTRATLKVISGLEWSLGKRGAGEGEPAWTAGVFWAHFSNANVFERNAGYDGLVFRVGRSLSR